MIEQIYKLTTIHQFQYIFPTRYLYTYTLSEKRAASTIYMFDTQALQKHQVLLRIERDGQ
jgi:hypothetical protein